MDQGLSYFKSDQQLLLAQIAAAKHELLNAVT